MGGFGAILEWNGTGRIGIGISAREGSILLSVFTGRFYVHFLTIILNSKRPDGVNRGGEDGPIWSDGRRRD